tara:strand:+ start:1478 stop:2554 length:1077 start_codon:yes stop_codon:yes gene_type:complete
MRPDMEFPTEDGKYPIEWLGKKIVRVWKIAPKKAAVLQADDREFLLLILKDAIGNMPGSPYSYDYAMRGHVFGKNDMGLVKQHHPKFVKDWERISGIKPKDDIPYWYKERLILQGDYPFSMAMHVETWLENNRWKPDKKMKGWYSKKVGQGLVRLYGTDHYSRELVLYASPTPYISSQWGDWDSEEYKQKREEFREATERRLPIEGTTGKDLEAKAVEVSQAVKAYRPKPKRRVLTDKDKERIKDFNEAVRGEVLGGYLKEDGRNEWTGEWNEGSTTRDLSNAVLWWSGGLEAYERYFGWGSERQYGPSGFGKKEVGRLFRKVLDQMLKEGLLVYDRTEKKWWKSKSAGRVAKRFLDR